MKKIIPIIILLVLIPGIRADDIETSILTVTSEETDISTFGDIETQIYFTRETTLCGNYNNEISCEMAGCYWCSSIEPKFCGNDRSVCQAGGSSGGPLSGVIYEEQPTEITNISDIKAITAEIQEEVPQYGFLLLLLVIPILMAYHYREDIDKKLSEYPQYVELKKKVRSEIEDDQGQETAD